LTEKGKEEGASLSALIKARLEQEVKRKRRARPCRDGSLREDKDEDELALY
jgi:hypothetical protein